MASAIGEGYVSSRVVERLRAETDPTHRISWSDRVSPPHDVSPCGSRTHPECAVNVTGDLSPGLSR